MTQLSDERGGPWTSHGHAVDGVTVAGGHPPMVARCGGPAICSVCAGDAERLRRESDPTWLVWSNQRGMWWRANRSGYTQFIEEAGRYSREEAAQIVSQATLDGELKRHRIDPVTEKVYASLDEVAVLAPSS